MDDGVMVHGLFMEAMRWDVDNMNITDSLPGEMNPVRPLDSLLYMIVQIPRAAIASNAHGTKKKPYS